MMQRKSDRDGKPVWKQSCSQNDEAGRPQAVTYADGSF